MQLRIVALITLFFSVSIFSCTKAMLVIPAVGVYTARSMDLPFPSVPKIVYLSHNKKANLAKAIVIQELADTTQPAYFEGMNEYGLGAHALYLGKTQYPKKITGLTQVGAMLWVPYVLQHSKTVRDALKALPSYQVYAQTFYYHHKPSSALLHLAIEDPSGDSAIVEFLNGKTIVHHHPQSAVLTNMAYTEQQLAERTCQHPETLYDSSARSRALRASYIIKTFPIDKNNQSLATRQKKTVIYLNHLMQQVAEPQEDCIAHPDTCTPTRWHVILDNTHRMLYFSTHSQFDRNLIEED